MNLPENNRIQKLLTIEEIDAEIESADYSAEMLLQHLIAHWNCRGNWQPISTAPLNESVLIYIPNADHLGPGIYRGLKVERHGGPIWLFNTLSMSFDPMSLAPSHWQPLPPPPSHE